MRYRKFLLPGIGLIILLVILLAWRASTFHLVGTSPGDGSRPNQYTAVSFMFNKAIKSQGASLNQITISPGISGKTTVGQKSVTFVPTSAFQTGTVYSAVLSGVISKGGKPITNIHISFTPQYIDYADLPKDVQQRLVSQTDTSDRQKPPYSAGIIAIGGADYLSNHGVTSRQLDDLQIAFYNFFVSKKEQVRGVVLANLVKQPRNPNDSSAADTVTFEVKLNNDSSVSYKGRVVYPDLISLSLFLYNPSSGALVYNSGYIH